ncbi:MAG: DUF4091 domain-containing protein [Tessaracoccus sp.]|uniref:DUF4091 domain-containing protein n=1 Tax=Tessaracoccus sp. TaxID=1971211 RepID=UPI001EBBE8EF|nr:DUF4091 domain-containing protein [Tessaracoccus sp.]MBK7821667.1 DUF4091 domain-containing protein [Tessaracoccus sp.]
MQSTVTAVVTHSLTKVTADWKPTAPLTALTGWSGERVSFQVAWLPPSTRGHGPQNRVEVEVDGAGHVSLFDVELVPVQAPCWPEHSTGYIADRPGLLPDLLRPRADGARTMARHTGWHSVWVDVVLPSDDLRVTVRDGDTLVLDHRIEVHTVERPAAPPELTVAQWFHADCLATYYGVDTWSEDHWTAIAGQLRSLRRLGATMALTPVWTPPLDTDEGIDRRTTQLLDIRLADGVYHFGHERLDRWMALLADAGIAQVEVPHLFTQWGAKYAPQVWVEVDGAPVKLFGWHTHADDPAYVDFLAQALPFLKEYFGARVGLENTFFHVSDEPSEEHLASYLAAKGAVGSLLDECRLIDALSEHEYAAHVPTPIVATNAVEGFRRAGVEPGWVYYCISQSWELSNRFIALDGVRTRALGWQLYKTGAIGFLHWGFNFYNSVLSRRAINPFVDTAAGGGFLSGDAFIVYPGPDLEPLESQRHRLIADAMQDLAAAQRAESILGRDQVLAIVDPDGDLDYATGWVSSETWLERRSTLDDAARAALN